MGTINDQFWSINQDVLLQELQTSHEGLSSIDAERRLEIYGPNSIKTKKTTSSLFLFIRQFKSPLVLILLGAAILAFVTADSTDGLIITSILLLSSIIGFWEEHMSTRAVERLLSIIKVTAEVVRDGVNLQIPLENVVPGDVVILNAGDVVPGDCIILESKDLFVNEAALTGETMPDEKRAGVVAADTQLSKRANVLFMGTSVSSGTARAVVVTTGLKTEFGRVTQRLSAKEPKTEFERGMDRFGSMLMQLTMLFVLVIFALNVYFERPIVDSFLFVLALAVGITPELLPAITSITLAQGAKQMAEKKVVVKKLTSIENFGSMNILCSDKTGTITEGIMKVQSTVGPLGNTSAKVLLYAYLNASFQTGYENPVDKAIVKHTSINLEGYTKLDEIPYDFVRKRLSILVTDGPSKLMISKGAVLNLLSICTSAELANGTIVPLEDVQDTINELNNKLSGQGLRTLGVAFKNIDEPLINRGMEKDMRFLGFVVLSDPLKQDAKETIEALHSLNVDFKIITGDNQLIAGSIGAQLGWKSPNILAGTRIRQMSDEALIKQAPLTDIFAEIEPNQKERIILALRKAGNVVGYIGDGINDASALHAADVGISVESAVDVAKESAEIVLLEKDLSVLVKGISLGRRTFANTIKYITVTISANFGNMISMAGASLLFWFLPLLPSQILAINFLSDFPATTISTDNVDFELIDRPRRWDIGFIKRFMVVFGVQSTLFDFMTFGVLLLWLNSTVDQFRTGWFILSIATEIVVMLVIRTQQFFLKSRPSKSLILSSVIVMAIVLVLPYTPIAELLNLVILPTWTGIGLLGIVAAYIVTAEITKMLFYRRGMKGILKAA
jgi:Mg2+-importing ATPase